MKSIKAIILQYVKKHKSITAADIVNKYNVTRQAVNKQMHVLIQEGLVIKHGTSKAKTSYILNDKENLKKIFGNKIQFQKKYSINNLQEDIVYKEIKTYPNILNNLNNNDNENFQYVFTEILNNSIDHSSSKYVDVLIEIDAGRLKLEITDKGVGIFENISQKKNLKSEIEAIQDLLKGKNTTMPERHSGEGIFFTSKIADYFCIDSHRKKLIIDNRINDIFIEDVRYLKGTKVCIELDLPSKKTILNVFKEFTNEDFKFQKSKVSVKLYDSGECYISRSQAKRLLHSLENFNNIVLDFAGIKTVGQAFADEVFRIFLNNNPNIKIEWINANENISFMIKRALVD